MNLTRLFIGGHREIRRPIHVVDESLMRRIEEARERLRREGKEVRPVRTLGERQARAVPSVIPSTMGNTARRLASDGRARA